MPKHKATLKDLLHKGVQNLDPLGPNLDPLGPNQTPLANQQPRELYVNEPGLYGLIFLSISSNSGRGLHRLGHRSSFAGN